MGWRLHFSTQPVSALEYVPGDPLLIAVWDARHNVYFYDQRNANPTGNHENQLQNGAPVNLEGDSWREYVAEVRSSDGRFLPTVKLGSVTVYTSRDGHMRLYHFQDGRLELEVDGRCIALDREQDGRFVAAGLDRALGLIGAITETGVLCIFQQHIRVGTFSLGLSLDVETRLNVLVPDARGKLVIGDGERVMVVDAAGSIRQEMPTYYTAGPMAVSPNGEMIALADADDNVIRVYDGDLNPIRQRHAIDLIADARQVQLLAAMPGRRAALAALDISDDESLVFALGGVICETPVAALDALPQPRPLF